MATSVYDQSMAAFGPLNRLMAGRLDLTNQRIAQELAMQDFARKQAAQESQSEKSFGRYADLMREQQAERSAESERAFVRQEKKEKDAAKERKTQREQEEQAARDLTAAKLGLPSGLSREELMEEISNQNDPQTKKQAFKNNQKALIKLYGDIEQKSAITPLESKQIQEQASAMAEMENAKNRITKPGIGDLPATTGYPEGYRPKTAADFTRDLFLIAREGKRSALRPLISQAEVLESKQKELSAGIQDIASLLRTQEDQATGGPTSEFNPVNEHSTGPDGAATDGPATSKMTQADQVAAGLEKMLQARKQAQNPSTPRTGPSLPLVTGDPVGVAGDYWAGKMVDENGRVFGGVHDWSQGVIDEANARKAMAPLGQATMGPGLLETAGDYWVGKAGGIGDWSQSVIDEANARKNVPQLQPSTEPMMNVWSNYSNDVLRRNGMAAPLQTRVNPWAQGGFGIPTSLEPGIQTPQLQTAPYKPYNQTPLIQRIALREYALRRGFAPTEIEAVEAGVAAGDPVATARAKRLHDEMVTELQLQNSAK